MNSTQQKGCHMIRKQVNKLHLVKCCMSNVYESHRGARANWLVGRMKNYDVADVEMNIVIHYGTLIWKTSPGSML